MEIKRNKAWRRFQENRVFKARMLKFAGWQIVVWDENGNCIEHPHWFEIAKEKWQRSIRIVVLHAVVLCVELKNTAVFILKRKPNVFC